MSDYNFSFFRTEGLTAAETAELAAAPNSSGWSSLARQVLPAPWPEC
jgi:hypothetical protein